MHVLGQLHTCLCDELHYLWFILEMSGSTTNVLTCAMKLLTSIAPVLCTKKLTYSTAFRSVPCCSVQTGLSFWLCGPSQPNFSFHIHCRSELPAVDGPQVPSIVLMVELSSASISFSNSSPLDDSLSPVRYSLISFFFCSGVPFSSTSSSSSELKHSTTRVHIFLDELHDIKNVWDNEHFSPFVVILVMKRNQTPLRYETRRNSSPLTRRCHFVYMLAFG